MRILWQATISGQPCSKSNSRRLVRFGNRPASIKSAKGIAYQESFLWQVKTKRPPVPLAEPMALYALVFYESQRPDLDVSLIMDCLQHAEIIKNDRLLREQHLYHAIDKSNPRCVLILAERGDLPAELT